MKKYLLLALTLSASAFAAPKESPAQIVQKLYDAYQQPSVQENTAAFEDYASAELKALLAKDEQLAGDEIGCIDYDFVIQGQDYDAESIKKNLKIKALDKESVEAKFQNFRHARNGYLQIRLRRQAMPNHRPARRRPGNA